MELYAITYTDASEPWGHAVEDGKLYRTPTALVDAWNDHFDAWRSYSRWRPEVSLNTVEDDYRERWEKWGQTDYPGQSFEEFLVQEYAHEYGVARYQVVD